MPISDSICILSCSSCAQKLVVGLRQVSAFCEMLGQKMQLSPTNSTVFFTGRFRKRLGTTSFFLHIHISQTLILAQLVPVTIPMLLGLDTLEEFKRNILTVRNRSLSVSKHYKLPLVKIFGNSFLLCKEVLLYTVYEPVAFVQIST